MWGRLDEPPGVGLLNGSTTRGDPELAVDGFDLGSYRAWGYVEALRHLPGGELADEEAKHIELALCELPVKLPLPRLVPAKFALLALQKLGKMPASGYLSRMVRASTSTFLAPARSPRIRLTEASASNPMRVGQGLRPGNSRRTERPASNSVSASSSFPRLASTKPSAMGARVAWGTVDSLSLSTSPPASLSRDSASSRCPSSAATTDRRDRATTRNKGWSASGVRSRAPSSAFRAPAGSPERYSPALSAKRTNPARGEVGPGSSATAR